jgi:hypothetical protein
VACWRATPRIHYLLRPLDELQPPQGRHLRPKLRMPTTRRTRRFELLEGLHRDVEEKLGLRQGLVDVRPPTRPRLTSPTNPRT